MAAWPVAAWPVAAWPVAALAAQSRVVPIQDIVENLTVVRRRVAHMAPACATVHVAGGGVAGGGMADTAGPPPPPPPQAESSKPTTAMAIRTRMEPLPFLQAAVG